MPQHVWPSGKSTVTPSRRRSFTMATPTSGKNMSPRQVIMSEAFTRLAVLAVRRRRGHHDEYQQGIGPVIGQPVIDPRRRHERVAGGQPLLLPTELEAALALQHVVDLVLIFVAVRLLLLAGAHAIEVEMGSVRRR